MGACNITNKLSFNFVYTTSAKNFLVPSVQFLLRAAGQRDRSTLAALCLLLLLIGPYFPVHGQGTAGASLTGTVRSEQRPVEFATVLLFGVNDSVTVVHTAATDTLGRYTFTGIKPGKYSVQAKMIGFKPRRSPAILVNPESSVVTADVISLVTQSQQLQVVTIEGERPIAERSLGKVTLNVSNPFFKTATNALEVLRRAPGVIVDPTGAITLNGTVTPVVYLEGRQLPLSTEEIRSLPSEDIEQIELMSNASARYDGETRAVVNIKLKRDKTLGLKGSTYAGGSVNSKYAGYEAGISATYKTKQLAYYGRVGYSELNNFLRNSSLRKVQDDEGNLTTFDQYTFIHTRPRPLAYQAVADYSLSKKHTVSLLVKGLLRPERDVTTNTNNINTTSLPGTTTEAYRLPSSTVSNADLTNVAIDLSYRGVLNATGDELQAYADYAYYNTQQEQVFRTFFPTPASNTLRFPAVLRGQFPTTTRISSLRTDYTHTINPLAKLSLGGKLNQTKTDNTLKYDTASTLAQEVYFPDASRSNRFTYEETIAAGYGGLTVEKGANTLDAALRMEYTHSDGNSRTLNNVVRRNYYR